MESGLGTKTERNLKGRMTDLQFAHYNRFTEKYNEDLMSSFLPESIVFLIGDTWHRIRPCRGDPSIISAVGLPLRIHSIRIYSCRVCVKK